MPTLTIREPGRVAVQVAAADGIVFGRDHSCDVVLSHRSVSRRHARLSAASAGWHIVDLGSTHGTHVDGQRVGDAPVPAGAIIQLGNVFVELHDQDPTAPGEELTIRPPLPELAPPAPEAKRLNILFELSRAVGACDGVDQLVGGVLEAILDAFGCERGVVELHTGGAARRVARGAAGGEFVVSRAVQRALLERRERVLVRGAQVAEGLSLVKQGVRSAMGAPLLSGNRVLGFVYVDDRARADRFSGAELDFLTAVAHLTAAAVDQALERLRLEAAATPTGDLVGASEPVERLRKEIHRYALARDTAVLIRGESGTGKELVARALHDHSPRARAPFVALNCAAIPDTMFESELFGYERGAFTGAVKPQRGKFVLADGGTLFLDEVGDLSLAAQAKLLRVLEMGEIVPLGSERPIEVDVRVLAATNKPLEQDMAAGRFRQDLFYRLAVGEIHVPPLRARGDDIVLLAEMFRQRFAAQLGKRVTGFAPELLAALRGQPWPGNVRQLKNEIERAVILADGALIEELSVPLPPSPTAAPAEPALVATLEEAERNHIEIALRAHRGNIMATATAVGVSRGLLYRKIAKYRIKV